jgi:hypothetical protein
MGREAGEGNMRFQVGKFVCELSVNEGGRDAREIVFDDDAGFHLLRPHSPGR